MNREGVVHAFKSYTENYDVEDVKIALKVAHTYRVAGIAERIALSLGMEDADIELSWFLGMLHDIGRFEQLKNYGTFKDAESVDHAELGADILFRPDAQGDEGENRAPLIETFPVEGLPKDWLQLAETAIRLHNKLAVPKGLDERTRLFCVLLRDADKVDIFRVLTEPPYDERNEGIAADSAKTASPAREDVMACVFQHRCVPKTFERTPFESLISQCCMGFELEYAESRRIAAQQGYLERLMGLPVEDRAMKAQLDALRIEMHNAWAQQGKEENTDEI